MPLIKITTDRQPWAAGSPHDKGAEVEVDADEAAALVANGFAEMVAAAPRKRRSLAEDGEAL
jgi:hypothetical protein